MKQTRPTLSRITWMLVATLASLPTLSAQRLPEGSAQHKFHISNFAQAQSYLDTLSQKYRPKEILIVTDLDHTMIAPEGHLGASYWFRPQRDYLKTPDREREQIAEDLDELVAISTLIHESQPFRFVEPTAPQFLTSLQQTHPVAALTKRYLSWKDATHHQLASLQVNYSISAPGSQSQEDQWTIGDDLVERYQLKSDKEISYKNGVLLTNAHKGAVLQSFLDKFDLRDTYKAILLIDDTEKNSDDVLAAFEGSSIEVVTLVYHGDDKRAEAFRQDPQSAYKEWLSFQKEFVSPRLNHGVIVGEVGTTTAQVWSRCGGPATFTFEWATKDSPSKARKAQTRARVGDDFTVKLKLSGLKPDTRYTYLAHCGRRDTYRIVGTFQTAPIPQEAKAFRLTFGADVGGQNACRDIQRGFPIFSELEKTNSSIFIGLGDMVYVDTKCEAKGIYGLSQIPVKPEVAFDLAGFRKRWRYVREDLTQQSFFSKVAYYGVWDDHEVVNDFGPQHATRRGPPFSQDPETIVELFKPGAKAFEEYTPLPKGHYYRSFQWGKHAEVFLLDTRSFRDANHTPDHPKKTMLGRAQLNWLKHRLKNSRATWKIIASSVPLSVPTGKAVKPDSIPQWGLDAFGGSQEATFQNTGFASELKALVTFMSDEKMSNVLWLTGDIHFPQFIEYQPTKTFKMYEMTTGPLHAYIDYKEALDPSLNPIRQFMGGLKNQKNVNNLDEAIDYFNFGLLDVDASGKLTLAIVNGRGVSLGYPNVTPRAPRMNISLLLKRLGVKETS